MNVTTSVQTDLLVIRVEIEKASFQTRVKLGSSEIEIEKATQFCINRVNDIINKSKVMIIDEIVDLINTAINKGYVPVSVFINREQERRLHFKPENGYNELIPEMAGNGCIDTIAVRDSNKVKVVVVDEEVWKIQLSIKIK